MDDNNNSVWTPGEESTNAQEVQFETQKNEPVQPSPSQPAQNYYVSGTPGSYDQSSASSAAPGMTLQEFSKLPEMKSLSKNITIAAILCYVGAGMTALVSVLGALGLNIYSLLDAVLLLVLGLILHMRRSFPAAIVLLVYSSFSMIVMYVYMHQFGGWLLVIAGILAVMYCYQLRKAYKDYQMTGRVNPMR